MIAVILDIVIMGKCLTFEKYSTHCNLQDLRRIKKYLTLKIAKWTVSKFGL